MGPTASWKTKLAGKNDMKASILLAFCAVGGCWHGDSVQHDTSVESANKGQKAREIRALSEDEIQGLLDGDGLGYARAAELNGYPGPRHVLDLAGSLTLTAEQARQVETIFSIMRDSARVLGRQLVEAERHLDDVFSNGHDSGAVVIALVEAIGRIESRLRYTHLAAHLETADILSESQIEAYAKLRGYHDGADHSRHDTHEGHEDQGT
jgi:hypothetical protein